MRSRKNTLAPIATGNHPIQCPFPAAPITLEMPGGFLFRRLSFVNCYLCIARLTNIIQVIRYDDGPYAIIQEVVDLEAYISQNRSDNIWRRREIRMALRALDGQVVFWPYEHITVAQISLLLPPQY